MRTTRIITAFIQNDGRFLILKRSKNVRTMKGLWSGISGIIEGDEEPLERAKTEIFEETGIAKDTITLARSAVQMTVDSPQYDHRWKIFPFLFDVKCPRVKLNWENSEYRWIKSDEMKNYKTVPSLDRVLFNLL